MFLVLGKLATETLFSGEDDRAGDPGHAARDHGGFGHRRQARRVHVLHRHCVHEPVPRPQQARRRLLLERPRILQEDQGMLNSFFNFFTLYSLGSKLV